MMSDKDLLNLLEADPKQSSPSPSRPSPNNGWYGASLFAGVSLAIAALSLPFISPALRRHAIPYLPATDNQLHNLITCLKRHPHARSLVDLGSGDGRVVIQCARLGIRSVGVELNPWLVLYSKLRTTYLGLNHLASFKRQDLWKVDISKFDGVVIFGVDEMMKSLEDKIISDCSDKNKDITVFACRFPLPKMSACEIVGSGLDRIWVYDKLGKLQNQ